VGRLELPLPELGRSRESLDEAAKRMQDLILAHVPERFRESISVGTFREGERTGIAIEYDDLAESFVYAVLEYPRGGEKTVAPE
jgi:hypothetical protein